MLTTTDAREPKVLARAVHPGDFIRTEVLPAGLTVTDAARALGVSRAALSNLLNGHADLSPEMAIRLEKAFDAPGDALLRLQTAYHIAAARSRAPRIRVSRYQRAS